MKINLLRFIPLTAAIVLWILICPAYSEGSDAFMHHKDVAVTIYLDDRDGNHIMSAGGVILDPEGIIATDCLIIVQWLKRTDSRFDIELHSGIHLPIQELISSRCTNNLALIRVEAKDLPSAKLAPDFPRKPGDDIVLTRGPSGGESVTEKGTVKSIIRKDKLFQISIPVTQQKSGSPLFNMEGEVIGAAVFIPKKFPHNNGAVFLKDIARELEKHRPAQRGIVSIPPVLPEKQETEKISRDPVDYFLLGSGYEKTGRYSQAIDAYSQALTLKPDYLEAYLNLGLVYYKLGRYPDAIGIYKKVLDLNPDSSETYNNLGTMYLLDSQYPQAIDTFRKLLAREPDNPVAHFNLGISHFLSGDTVSAFGAYQTLMKLDREKADILRNIIN